MELYLPSPEDLVNPMEIATQRFPHALWMPFMNLPCRAPAHTEHILWRCGNFPEQPPQNRRTGRAIP